MKRFLLSSILLALLVALGTLGTNVSIDNSKWLSEDDPQEILNRYIKEKFNKREELVVAIQTEQPFFSGPVVDALMRIDQKIKDVLRPQSYTHPLNLSFLFRDDTDEEASHIEVGTLKKQILTNKKTLLELEQEFQSSYYQGRYISEDQKSFLLVVKPADKNTAEEEVRERVRLVEGFEALIKEEPLFRNYRMAGSVKLYQQMNTQNKEELLFLVPLTFSLIIVLLAFYYMSFKVVGIIAFSGLISLAGTFSLFNILGLAVNIMTSIAPLLIMAIAISDSIHIINRYVTEKGRGLFRWQSFMGFTWKPCLITSLTTAMGFLSFYGSEVLIIKQLSIVASLSVILAYFLIILSNWSLLYIMNPRVEPCEISLSFLSPFLVFEKSLPKKVSAAALVIFGSVIIYLFSFTEANLLDSFFKKGSHIQQDFAYIDQNHGGTGAFELILNGPLLQPYRELGSSSAKGGLVDFKDIEDYRKIALLDGLLKDLPYVKRLDTYVMPVRMVHEKLTKNQGVDPDTNEKLAQEILFLEFSQSAESEDILRPFLSFDERQKSGRMVLRTKNLSNRESADLKKMVEEKLDFLGWSIDYAGNSQYFLRLSELILNTQAQSLTIAFVVVFLLMSVFYNFKAACLLVAANIIPVVGVLFSIVVFRNPFDFSTILISSIGLGICVDDNIHLIHHIFKSPRSSGTIGQLKAIFIHAMKPVCLVSAIFIGVFLIFGTSEVVLLQRFGFFSAFMIAVSLLVNIFFLPSILAD